MRFARCRIHGSVVPTEIRRLGQEDGQAVCPWCEQPVVPIHKGKPVGKHGKLSEQQIAAAHRLHFEAGLSIRELGRRLYERYGYSSAASCAVTLSAAFKARGLPTHDRVQMVVKTMTKHGFAKRDTRYQTPEGKALRARQRRETGEVLDRPQCAATKTRPGKGRGERCQNKALADEDYCYAHSRQRAAERHTHLAAMRAVAKAETPSQVPADPKPS